ncbi:MAG: hypothetical protein PHN30_02580 [Bacteroidales bacterium]|nr:hypothetical protein [Bacteroidales bacterium]
MATLRLTLIIILLLTTHLLMGQARISNDPPEVIAVFEAMYQYDLREAEKMLNSLDQKRINSNLIELTRANLLWWWLISGDESRDYAREMESGLKSLIDKQKLKPIERMSQDELFTMVHAYAYLTRLDIFREKYFKGILNLSSTMKYLEAILVQHDRYDKFMLVAGLYHYFASATMTEYPIFIPFFALAPKSNRQLGYQLLKKCSAMPNLLIQNEALYYTMKINYQLEKKFNEALLIADQLIQSYPNNLTYQFHRMMILLDAGRNTDAFVQYQRLRQVSATAPYLNQSQREHMVDEARKKLEKKKINLTI